MQKLVLLLTLLAFTWYGASPVPQCYVTEPDCPVRGTDECPFLSGHAEMMDTGMADSCPLSELPNKKHKSSIDKMDRFKLYQLTRSLSLEPVAGPAPVTVVSLASPFSSAALVPISISRRPPDLFYSLLLQKQSLLI